MNSLSVDERLFALKKIDALTSFIDQQTQRAPKFVNHSGGQGNSSYNYKEQAQQLSDNEGIYALLEEDIRKCNLVFQNLKEEIQEPLLVEEKGNKSAIEEEQTMERRQAEEHHLLLKMKNVLVGIDKFSFPTDCVIVGMEEEQQVTLIGTPSTATSQALNDVKHREMTLLVGKKKVKFNLHHSIQLTVKERNSCKWIESSLLHFEKQAPRILQGDTIEGSKLNTNSSPIKELGLKPLLTIPEMEELILMKDEDGGALKDSGTLMSLASTHPQSKDLVLFQ